MGHPWEEKVKAVSQNTMEKHIQEGGGQGRILPIENMGDIQVSKRLGGVLGEDAPKGTI